MTLRMERKKEEASYQSVTWMIFRFLFLSFSLSMPCILSSSRHMYSFSDVHTTCILLLASIQRLFSRFDKKRMGWKTFCWMKNIMKEDFQPLVGCFPFLTIPQVQYEYHMASTFSIFSPICLSITHTHKDKIRRRAEEKDIKMFLSVSDNGPKMEMAVVYEPWLRTVFIPKIVLSTARHDIYIKSWPWQVLKERKNALTAKYY